LSFSPELTAELAAAGPGQLRKHEKFVSRFVSKNRDLVVYLPGIYEKRPDLRFPILYLEDGQNLFDPATSFIPGMFWHVGETADALIAQGAIQPLIIVGIYNTDKRLNEYTPTRDKKMGGGRADKYGSMLTKELQPFIESNYRVLTDPMNTGMGGSSLGGLLTVYLGLKYPSVFGKLAVLSPSVWWNQRAILDFVARAPLKAARPRIWLDAGTKEGASTVQNVTALRDSLIRRGWQENQDLHFELIPDAQHNEDAWSRRVGPFLQFLFPAGETAA
jgi:predicted alpha/beta superfamily hydrolase